MPFLNHTVYILYCTGSLCFLGGSILLWYISTRWGRVL